jgi:hypothetical protein
MKELMIHVERIVRPVRADWSKARMRRELLEHLQAAFEEERARGLDEGAAVEAAKRRLGEAAELTRELQGSVSRFERLAVTPFPGPVRLVLLVIGLLLSVLFVYAIARRLGLGDMRMVFLAGVFTMGLSGVFWYFAVVGVVQRRIRWGRVTWFGVAAVVVQAGWMGLFSLSLTGRVIPGDLSDAVLAQLMIPGFLLAVGINTVLTQRRFKEWHELDIAAG